MSRRADGWGLEGGAFRRAGVGLMDGESGGMCGRNKGTCGVRGAGGN